MQKKPFVIDKNEENGEEQLETGNKSHQKTPSACIAPEDADKDVGSLRRKRRSYGLENAAPSTSAGSSYFHDHDDTYASMRDKYIERLALVMPQIISCKRERL